jgi:hypothetical protein
MKARPVMVAVVALVLMSCADQQLPTEITVPLFARGANADFILGTHLTGDEEVLTSEPHPSSSKAQGQAIFRVGKDETTVSFRLIAANIENVIMAHIHCGLPGEVGPPVVWLYPVIGTSGAPDEAGGGRFSGVLASGSFSPEGVMCLAANVGEDMSLLDAMRAGLTYVNVHTNDGVGDANTGPGDFPGGEIRGQIDESN